MLVSSQARPFPDAHRAKTAGLRVRLMSRRSSLFKPNKEAGYDENYGGAVHLALRFFSGVSPGENAPLCPELTAAICYFV